MEVTAPAEEDDTFTVKAPELAVEPEEDPPSAKDILTDSDPSDRMEMLAGYPVATWGNVLATATTHAYDGIVASDGHACVRCGVFIN